MNTLSANANKPLFPRNPGLGIPTLVLCLLASALLLTDSRTTVLAPVRQSLAVTLQPVIWLAELPSTLSHLGEAMRDRSELRAENATLERTLLRQEARLKRLAAVEAENSRLRELLASSEQIDDHVLVAEILNISQNPYKHQLALNRGARDGVYEGQAIVDAHGVLGQIVAVHPSTSIAMLITDPNHGIPVEVNRTGLQTVASGRGEGGGLTLPFLPGNADIRVGDLLVSSALGGRFPAGYPVAEVSEIKYQPGEHFMHAVAFPAARTKRGRQVLLVWSESYPMLDAEFPADAGTP